MNKLFPGKSPPHNGQRENGTGDGQRAAVSCAQPLAGEAVSMRGRTVQDFRKSIPELKGFAPEAENQQRTGKQKLIQLSVDMAAEYLTGRKRYNNEDELFHSLRMAEELARLGAHTWHIAATLLHSLHFNPEKFAKLGKELRPGWFAPIETSILLLNKPYKANGRWLYPCNIGEKGGKPDYRKNDEYFVQLGRKRKDVPQVDMNEEHARMLFTAWNTGLDWLQAPLIIKLMNSWDNLRTLEGVKSDSQKKEIIQEALPYVQVARVLNWEFFVSLRRRINDNKGLFSPEEWAPIAERLKDRDYGAFESDGCIKLPPRSIITLEELPDANCPLLLLFYDPNRPLKEIELKALYLANGNKEKILETLVARLQSIAGDSRGDRVERGESKIILPGWGEEFVILSVTDRDMGGHLESYKAALKEIYGMLSSC